MKTFSYAIKNTSGIHARPAGVLARMAEEFDSKIIISKNEKSTELKKLISVMQLNVMYNDTVKITINGADENKAFSYIKAYFEENL